MIAKKNPKADLEKKRFAFFQIGLIIAGSACLAAFEFSTVTDDALHVERMGDESRYVLPSEPLPDYTEPKQEEKKKAVTIIIDEIEIVKKKAVEGDPIIVEKGLEKITFDDGGETGELGFNIVAPEVPPTPYPDVEPYFPGGVAAMGDFINDQIDLPDYIPAYDQGIVYVQFVVNKDGTIEQVGIRKGLSIELDEAAKDVVSKMPKWIPGEQAGKPVRVRFTLPISIQFN